MPMQKGQNDFYIRVGKPLLDRALGLFALVGLSWLFALLALVIWLDDPGPVVFKQKRVGIRKNGELSYFNIYKFRTMHLDAPHDVPLGAEEREAIIEEGPRIIERALADMGVETFCPPDFSDKDFLEDALASDMEEKGLWHDEQ